MTFKKIRDRGKRGPKKEETEKTKLAERLQRQERQEKLKRRQKNADIVTQVLICLKSISYALRYFWNQSLTVQIMDQWS